MSKRLKNYPEPMKIIDKYGADAMRLYLLNSPAIKADDLCFSEKGVDQMLKKNLIILWNVFGFYKLYALKTKESFQKNQYQSLHVLDKWILSKMNALNKAITEAMEKYDLSQAVKPIEQFIDDLSIWYLRRSRQRFKDTENSQKASPVLKHVLFTLSKLISPFVPFISEQLYQSLKNEDDLISVHLCDYPKFDEELIDKKIEKEMEIVREIISLALAERAQEGLKVRQPLGELRIKNDELKDKEELLQLIKDEVNVKKVVFDDKLKKEMEIDKNITPELKEEGMMREGLRQIQVIRKKANLLPTDEIIVSFQGDDSILQLFKKNENQIKKELKIKEISWNKVNNFEFKSDIFLDSNNITIFLKKVN
jgi:isoleucyl-tRNA synthetase